mgnify:CR=1 FL=1
MKPDAAKAKGKWFSRKRLRTILLVVVPLIVVAIGVFIWLGSGRYISTDNAYVGAQKVLITPDISGKVIANYWLSQIYSQEAGDAHRAGGRPGDHTAYPRRRRADPP